ncbi:MAG TPA: branched-chain amino acid ABC transporter permease [Chthonomonadales bacterium]|nr:branched-chain amino acid ABC transporter permease [Chthonomonadales bacterium]
MPWFAVRVASIAGAVAALYLLSGLLTATIEAYVLQVLVQCGIYAILAVSLNLINGITGQFSIGHAGFFAVGAYVGAAWTMLWQPHAVRVTSALAMGTPAGDALNLLIACALGMAAASLAGAAVGLPSLRLRGDHLAIVTLGFGEVIRVLLLNIDAVGGARGLSGIPTLASTGDLAVFWVFLFLVLVIAVSRNLMNTTRGLTWLAVREDEVAADAMGVNTTRVKVTAFVLGSAFAGAAGVLYAHIMTGISPDVFGIDTSIIITTMVVLGGTGSVTGATLAAFLLVALPEMLRFMKDYRLVIFSTLLVLLMLTRPHGILGTRELGYATLFRRRQTGSPGTR